MCLLSEFARDCVTCLHEGVDTAMMYGSFIVD